MKKRSLVLALALALAPIIGAAQNTTTGAIQGTVLDQSGAVVPGALVEARNVDTNFTRSGVSAGDGRFVFLQLPPGPYTVTYTLTGFATLVQDGLTPGCHDLRVQIQLSQSVTDGNTANNSYRRLISKCGAQCLNPPA